jgi:hypothetical protein
MTANASSMPCSAMRAHAGCVLERSITAVRSLWSTAGSPSQARATILDRLPVVEAHAVGQVGGKVDQPGVARVRRLTFLVHVDERPALLGREVAIAPTCDQQSPPSPFIVERTTAGEMSSMRRTSGPRTARTFLIFDAGLLRPDRDLTPRSPNAEATDQLFDAARVQHRPLAAQHLDVGASAGSSSASCAAITQSTRSRTPAASGEAASVRRR